MSTAETGIQLEAKVLPRGSKLLGEACEPRVGADPQGRGEPAHYGAVILLNSQHGHGAQVKGLVALRRQRLELLRPSSVMRAVGGEVASGVIGPFSGGMNTAAHFGEVCDGAAPTSAATFEGDSCVLGEAHGLLTVRAHARRSRDGDSPLAPWGGPWGALVRTRRGLCFWWWCCDGNVGNVEEVCGLLDPSAVEAGARPAVDQLSAARNAIEGVICASGHMRELAAAVGMAGSFVVLVGS